MLILIKTVEKKPFLLLAVLTVLTTILLWLPFLLRLSSFWGISLPQNGMATVMANFDGPYYIVAAKTLYNPQSIQQTYSFPLPAIYYTAHYPLFPLLIRGAVTLFPFLSYPHAMLSVTIVTSILTVWMLYLLLRDLGYKKEAFWLASLFTIFPARWFIVRSIGSPEPLFLLTIIASVYYFRKQQWWLAGVFGALAQATKPPAILLFLAYALYLSLLSLKKRSFQLKAYPILLLPLTLLLIFAWYGVRFGNFLAYFNSGDNFHLFFPPFQVFNPAQAWVGSFWLEEIIWIYLLSGMGLLYLLKQKRVIVASFVGIFYLSILFVAHRDVARYSLPIVPFLFVAFANFLSSREFKLLFLLLITPIYLFAVTFIAGNVTPISDWTPLL